MAKSGLVRPRTYTDRLLSGREKRVMECLVEGKFDSEIAPIIGVRPRTVTRIVGELCDKLGVRRRARANLTAVYVRERGG